MAAQLGQGRGEDSLSLSSQATQGKKEHLYKILVIGDLGTGKTSIIKRYVHQFFSPHYRATVSSQSGSKCCGCSECSGTGASIVG